MKSDRTIHNILNKIAIDAIKNSMNSKPEKQLDTIAKAISHFVEASGDDILNSFGGKFQVEKQIRNEFPHSLAESDNSDLMSHPQVKQAIEKISAKIENNAKGAGSGGIVSRFMNTQSSILSKFKPFLIGLIIIAALAGIGYFIFKKYRHKIPFLDKILSKFSGKSKGSTSAGTPEASEGGSSEVSEGGGASEGGGGGRRREGRVRVRRRRH